LSKNIYVMHRIPGS